MTQPELATCACGIVCSQGESRCPTCRQAGLPADWEPLSMREMRAERDLYRTAVVSAWQCRGYPDDTNMQNLDDVLNEAVPPCETGPAEPGDCIRLCCRTTTEPKLAPCTCANMPRFGSPTGGKGFVEWTRKIHRPMQYKHPVLPGHDDGLEAGFPPTRNKDDIDEPYIAQAETHATCGKPCRLCGKGLRAHSRPGLHCPNMSGVNGTWLASLFEPEDWPDCAECGALTPRDQSSAYCTDHEPKPSPDQPYTDAQAETLATSIAAMACRDPKCGCNIVNDIVADMDGMALLANGGREHTHHDGCEHCGCLRRQLAGKDFDGSDVAKYDCGTVTNGVQSPACKVIAAMRPVVEAAERVYDGDYLNHAEDVLVLNTAVHDYRTDRGDHD
jgi:hypothetical protein